MRLGIFIALAFTGLFAPLWFFLICAMVYAFWTSAYELILLGMLIDAQFGVGTFHFMYTYTTALGSIVFLAEAMKPYLVFYKE